MFPLSSVGKFFKSQPVGAPPNKKEDIFKKEWLSNFQVNTHKPWIVYGSGIQDVQLGGIRD